MPHVHDPLPLAPPCLPPCCHLPPPPPHAFLSLFWACLPLQLLCLHCSAWSIRPGQAVVAALASASSPSWGKSCSSSLLLHIPFPCPLLPLCSTSSMPWVALSPCPFPMFLPAPCCLSLHRVPFRRVMSCRRRLQGGIISSGCCKELLRGYMGNVHVLCLTQTRAINFLPPPTLPAYTCLQSMIHKQKQVISITTVCLMSCMPSCLKLISSFCFDCPLLLCYTYFIV